MIPFECRVYIAINQSEDVIKIGATEQPFLAHKLWALKHHWGYTGGPFRFLSVYKGSRVEERRLHKLFVKHLIYGREWFRPVEEIREYASLIGLRDVDESNVVDMKTGSQLRQCEYWDYMIERGEFPALWPPTKISGPMWIRFESNNVKIPPKFWTRIKFSRTAIEYGARLAA